VAAGDLDGDGDPDFAVGNGYQQGLVFYNASIEINLKQGEDNLTGGYDFGEVMNGSCQDVEFTIENQGTWDLNLNSPLEVIGDDKDMFSLMQQPDTIMRGSDNTSFILRFSPTSLGGKTAAVSIPNNDPDESVLSFSVEGESVSSPDIEITGNSLEIVGGDDSPSTGDGTDFGAADISSGSISTTFVINNLGTEILNLTGEIPVVLDDDADFSVTLQPDDTAINPGDNTSFRITFDPVLQGERTAMVSLENSDTGENPYTFTIQGEGTTTEVNQLPAHPENIFPWDGEPDITLTTLLESSDFSDNNTGDFHLASRWQITRVSGDYSSPVYDSGTDSANLTEKKFPQGRCRPVLCITGMSDTRTIMRSGQTGRLRPPLPPDRSSMSLTIFLLFRPRSTPSP